MEDNLSVFNSNVDIDDTSFNSMKDLIKKELNFDSYQYNDNFLKRRLTVRIKANNLDSLKSYIPIFSASVSEKELLLKNLTIHVTEFFRDKTFWEYCKNTFFPGLIKELKGKKINIWSAGCSSGQEAISILITFLELDPSLKNNILITGTDISVSILDAAKKAEYDSYGAKGISEELIEKYFIKKDDLIILKDEFRNNFRFQKHDILQDYHLKNMDALFFRNTVIYFSKEAKDKLYKNIYDSLNNSSYLILGKTEVLSGNARDLFSIYDSLERVFLKK